MSIAHSNLVTDKQGKVVANKHAFKKKDGTRVEEVTQRFVPVAFKVGVERISLFELEVCLVKGLSRENIHLCEQHASLEEHVSVSREADPDHSTKDQQLH